MTDRASYNLGYMNGYADGVGDFRNAMKNPSGIVFEPPMAPRTEDRTIPEVPTRMVRKGLAVMADQQKKYYYTGLSTAYSIQANMVEDALDGRVQLDQVFTALRKQQLDAAGQTIQDNNGRNDQ